MGQVEQHTVRGLVGRGMISSVASAGQKSCPRLALKDRYSFPATDTPAVHHFSALPLKVRTLEQRWRHPEQRGDVRPDAGKTALGF